MEDKKEIINAYGWREVPSKNSTMISFVNDETKRGMNVYFTRMTIQVQGDDYRQRIFKEVDTIDKLENMLIEVSKDEKVS